MLLLVFNSHIGPGCIVGVGVAERSHLLRDNGDVLSRERKSERWRETEKEEVSEKRKETDCNLEKKSCWSESYQLTGIAATLK